MAKYFPHIIAFLIIPTLLSDPLFAAAMAGQCSVRIPRSTATFSVQRIQEQAISVPLRTSMRPPLAALALLPLLPRLLADYLMKNVVPESPFDWSPALAGIPSVFGRPSSSAASWFSRFANFSRHLAQGLNFDAGDGPTPESRISPSVTQRYLFGALEGRGAIVGDAGRFLDRLTTAKARAGRPVTVIMPRYRSMQMDKPVLSSREIHLKFDLPHRTGEIVLAVDEVEVESHLTYLLIRDPEGLFFEEPYLNSDKVRGLIEWVLLSKAIVALTQDGDLVHTHGWQVALVHEYLDQERYRFLHTAGVATAEGATDKGIVPGPLPIRPEDHDDQQIKQRLLRGGIDEFHTYQKQPVLSTHPVIGLRRSVLTDFRRLENFSHLEGRQINPGQIMLLKAIGMADRVGISPDDSNDTGINEFLAAMGIRQRVSDLDWPKTGRPDPLTAEGLSFYESQLYQPALRAAQRRMPFQQLGSDNSVRFAADPEQVTYLQLPSEAFNVLYPGSSVFTTGTRDLWLMVIGHVSNIIAKDVPIAQAPLLVFVSGLVEDGTPAAGMVRGYSKKELLRQMKQLIYHLQLMKVDVKSVFLRSPDGELKALPFQQGLKWLEASLRSRISALFSSPENPLPGDLLHGSAHLVDVRLTMQTRLVVQENLRLASAQALPPLRLQSLAGAG